MTIAATTISYACDHGGPVECIFAFDERILRSDFSDASWGRIDLCELPVGWDDLSPDLHPNDPPGEPPTDEELRAAVKRGAVDNLRRVYRFVAPRAGEYIELQVLKFPRKPGGFPLNFFAHAKNEDEFVELAKDAEQRGAPAVYVIPNAIHPAVATRAAPGKWYEALKGASTTDDNIELRRVVFIDVDPDRPSGTSSTLAQMTVAHAASKAIADRIAAVLGDTTAIGRGHSGNGGTVMIALDRLPVSDELTTIIRDILRALQTLHGSDVIKIDQAVSDPKRLVPAFGTLKRKGAPGLYDYPHRRSAFICADPVRRVGFDELMKVRDALQASAGSMATVPTERAQAPRARSRENVPRTKDTPFTRANELDPKAVGEWLGLFATGQLVCPGCGETTGVDVIDRGLKCFHDRCNKKGRDGFRGNVDLTAEVYKVTATEAARMLAKQFGLEMAPEPARKAGVGDDASAATGPGFVTIDVGLDLDRMVREVLDVLPGIDGLYQRDSRLHRVLAREQEPRQRLLDAARREALTKDPEADPNAGRPKSYVERPVGSLAMRVYTNSTLSRTLSNFVRFQHVEADEDGGDPEFTPCAPPASVLACLLDDGEWRDVPVLMGVASYPIVRADGTLAQQNGYDGDTGYVLSIPPNMPSIENEPTRQAALEALNRIGRLMSQFPWEDKQSDVARREDLAAFGADKGPARAWWSADFAAWLCLPLTILCRSAIDGPTPLFAVKGNVKGCGKSRLVDLGSLIVTGGVAARTTQPTNEEEMGKVLTSVAIEGDQLILFDNADRPVGGGKLDAFLTGARWKDRILGVSQKVDLPITTVLAVTGNNLTYTGDTTDRVLPIRLESDLENPRGRTGFEIDNILTYVLERRTALLHDLLIIARAYFAAGRPKTAGPAWGSFESWASIIPQILLWLGLPDPMSTRDQIQAEDPNDVALRVLVSLWLTVQTRASTNGMTAREFAEYVYDREGTALPGLTDVAAALEQLAPGRGREKVDVKRLGYVLRGATRRMINGKRLESIGSAHGSLRWTVL